MEQLVVKIKYSRPLKDSDLMVILKDITSLLKCKKSKKDMYVKYAFQS